VLIGHGHLESAWDAGQRSSPIQREEIAEADAESVALGHWDYLADVSTERVTAYYSGVPYHGRELDFANLVTLGPGRSCQVMRVALVDDHVDVDMVCTGRQTGTPASLEGAGRAQVEMET
jgi:hypothetical protein